ncbi:MAG: ACT domain-containing protein, partial [Planctomycetota bacterium]
NIGFTVSQSDVKEAAVVCEEMAKDIGFKQVQVDENVAKVSIVGIGMKSHTGVAAKMFNALADEKINIHNISTSEIVVSCMINQKEGDRALQVLHAAFELDKDNG